MKKIQNGTHVRVRDNEPCSLFGPLYDCVVSHYNPETAITIEHDNKAIVCIDTQRQPDALASRTMNYVLGHAQAGLIINLGTLREMETEYYDFQQATGRSKRTGVPCKLTSKDREK